MYSFLIPPAKLNYRLFSYRGNKPISLYHRGCEHILTKGQTFGIRSGKGGRFFRVVLGDDLNTVFAVTKKTAELIARGVK